MHVSTIKWLSKYSACSIRYLTVVLISYALATVLYAGEGADLEVGGPGSEPGKLLGIQDIAFDKDNNLYVLEGKYWDGKQNQQGNCRVQIFSNAGKLLDAFTVYHAELGDKNEPARLAITSQGDVFVTQPTAGFVVQYRRVLAKEPGKTTWVGVHSYPLQGAYAIAPWTFEGKERIAVVANWSRANTPQGGDRIFIIDPDGKLDTPIQLSHQLVHCNDLTTDAAGNFYLQGGVNQIAKFGPDGQLITVLGAGTTTRTGDGSELLNTVAVDSQGNIYSNTFGNPSNISRFNAATTEVTQHEGQFAWADAWGENLLFAIDKNDRLWIGVPGNTKGDQKYHYRPSVVRTEKNFFDEKNPKVSTHSTLLLGLKPTAEVKLPYNIAHDLAPISVDFVVKIGNRRVRDVKVKWVVYDIYKNEIAKGDFPLSLVDGQESRQPITFTPPKWGWYVAEFGIYQPDDSYLMGAGTYIGVTPKFTGMPTLIASDVLGGWIDPAAQAFSGLRLIRINTGQDIDKALPLIQKYGLTLLVQLENKDACTPEKVRAVVTKYRGRVKYWEIMNEPNFSMGPDDYAKMVKELVPLIKGIDPMAQVMGPTVCGVDLGWYEWIYQLGAGRILDAISIHDYEGNEAIDPLHWRWKIGALRAIMTRYGDGNKPIWQTERAIGGIRANTFQGGVQAVRITLQRDVMETLGIPNEHNSHYYVNQAGYSAVPTYIWCDSGPMPAALVLRTRAAMVLKRKYIGRLDFGPSGNKIFLGLRYTGTDGSTIVLRQYGTAEDPQIEFGVKGGDTLEVVDSFGNSEKFSVKNGKVTLTVPAFPIYLRLAAGQDIVAPTVDFGRNLASDATFAYSAKVKNDFSILTNGLFEVTHSGNPWGPFWNGEIPSFPQTFDISFETPRPVNKLILYSMRADNPHTDLLDFDVQYFNGTDWATIKQVRTSCPTSDLINTAESGAITWYNDQNFAIVDFPTVTTNKLRVVVLRTTLGFHPDAIAVKATGWQAGAPVLELREVEVYGPQFPIDVTASMASTMKTAAFTREPITVKVSNNTNGPVKGTIRCVVPEGWSVQPADAAINLAKGISKETAFQLLPPADVPTGTIPIRVEVVDAQGKLLEYTRLSLSVTPVAEVSPQAPQGNQGQLAFPVAVKNLGTTPLSGTVRLTFAGQGKLAPIERTFAALAPGKSVTVTLPAPKIKLGDADLQATFTVVANRLATSVTRLYPAARTWQLAGPFPSDGGTGGFDTVYPPEKGVDLTATYTLEDGRKIAWKTAMTNPVSGGLLDLNPLFQPNSNVCAYAVIYVKSPTARKALLSLGSDDGVKAWVNGKEAVSNNTSRGASPGQDQALVDLKDGWNEVMLKITQGGGGWGFYCDLLTPNGDPMTDLVYAAKKAE